MECSAQMPWSGEVTEGTPLESQNIFKLNSTNAQWRFLQIASASLKHPSQSSKAHLFKLDSQKVKDELCHLSQQVPSHDFGALSIGRDAGKSKIMVIGSRKTTVVLKGFFCNQLEVSQPEPSKPEPVKQVEKEAVPAKSSVLAVLENSSDESGSEEEFNLLGYREKMQQEKQAYIIWKKAQNIKLNLTQEQIKQRYQEKQEEQEQKEQLTEKPEAEAEAQDDQSGVEDTHSDDEVAEKGEEEEPKPSVVVPKRGKRIRKRRLPSDLSRRHKLNKKNRK